jgi:hypothetical protein
MAWPLDRPVPGAYMSDRRTKVYVWQTGTAYPSHGLATTPDTVAQLPADAPAERSKAEHRSAYGPGAGGRRRIGVAVRIDREDPEGVLTLPQVLVADW